MNEPPQRVVVFIDEANVYNDARRCFCPDSASSADGRIWPKRYAKELVANTPHGTEGRARELSEVRVYAGMPDSSRQSKLYGAHRRQTAGWEASGAKVIQRSLRYPETWPEAPPEQKGVDVQIAIDIVLMAVHDELDIAILASTDTDLIPAIEAVFTLPQPKTVEVAAWRSTGSAKRLRIKGHHLWCHYLDEETYERVRDHSHYAVAR